MKKIIILLAVVSSVLTINAQERGFYGNKFFDNWYIGAGVSLNSKTTHNAVFKNISPGIDLKIGKYFSPIFGVGVEGGFNFSNKTMENHWTSLGYNVGKCTYFQMGIFASANMMNAIKGYYGEPRFFEIQPVIGFYWGHNQSSAGEMGTIRNIFVNKLAIDFLFNLGQSKMFQIFVEPSLNYGIAGCEGSTIDEQGKGNEIVLWNINNSFLGLNIGLNYKFLTSNGSHNFMVVEACDQTVMDDLNNNVNVMRKKASDAEDNLAKLQVENERLKKALKECEDKPAKQVVKETVKSVYETPQLPVVFYPLNQSIITPAQQQNVLIVAEVLKKHPEYNLNIKGWASPEGPHDNNNDLGIRRANAVKDMLVKKYKISPSRIFTEGCGETDKLYEIFELNRVATMTLEKK